MEDDGSCLLELVVRRKRNVPGSSREPGRREMSWERSSVMVVVAGRAKVRVGGRPAPAILVMRTLIMLVESIVMMSTRVSVSSGIAGDCKGVDALVLYV